MFAAILRRWKLVAPLALTILAIAVVSAGVLNAASAHGVKFHFFGRGVVLEDNSLIFHDWQCDTGNLDINGGSLDTGHCNAVFGGSNTVGQNPVTAGNVIISTVFANATVKSDNTSHEGHVITTTDAEGLAVLVPFPTGRNVTVFQPILTSAQITNTAEAECEQKNGHVHASARAFTSVVFNDLRVLEGFNIDPVTGQFILAHLTPSGAANESFPIFNFVVQGFTFAEQLTVNEQQVFHDGGISFIKSNALHLIATDQSGTVLLDLIVDHDFAGIHCAKHLPQDDAIGA